MKKDKKWTKANRRRALEPLYKYWKQFETWSLEECGSLVAGIDPSFPMNANGPLVPIEKTSIRTIDVLIQSAVGASLKTLETDNERVLQSTFIEWAKDHLYEFLLPEFRLIFFEESGRGISAGLIRQNQAQITGPIARRNRLREFLETPRPMPAYWLPDPGYTNANSPFGPRGSREKNTRPAL